MDMIRISDDKLKLILDKKDMQAYALSADTLDYGNADTRRALWEILDEAKKKTGFNAIDNRILVQAYPDKRGGCEIFVTKMEEDEPPEPKSDKRKLRGRVSMFSFGDFEALLGVCAKLAASQRKYESSLYTHRLSFYLFIKEHLGDSILPASKLSSLSFIEEYAKRASGPLESAYIREHGEVILEESAIEKLAKLA